MYPAFQSLQTSRLVLRQVSMDDLDFVAELRGDPQVMRYYPKCLNREESRELIARIQQRYAEDGFGLWLAECSTTHEPRGLIGVMRQKVAERELIEVGYMVHHPYWRQGLASEAARACYNWVFEHLPTETVHSLIRPINLPSQGVARKNGLRPEPELVQHYELPHHVFTITRTEWAAPNA